MSWCYDPPRYSTRDWLRLRPILRRYKSARRRAIGLAYIYKKAPDSLALRNIVQQLGARPLAMTVVYNSAWMTKWHLRFSELNIHGVDRLIADNSSDPAEALATQTLCRDANVTYLKLPFNRFSLGRPKVPSLSHGCALNWLWHHVIAQARPPFVALLDQDLIPLRPVDLGSKVADQPFFGVQRIGDRYGWTIWPGYAVFSRSVIDRHKMDFWGDGPAGLDVGGANWKRVFRHYDANQLRFVDAPLNLIGRFEEWWHIGGISGYYQRPDGWRNETEAKLEREFDALTVSGVAKTT